MSTTEMGRPMQRDFGFKTPEDRQFGNQKSTGKAAEPSGKMLSPVKMLVVTLLIGVFGYLYIAHIFYTQELLREVNQLRTTYENARVDHTDTRLTYERMTGPADVYRNAKTLGLTDGGPADRIINRN